jgi:hypothetical protein
MVIKRPKRSKTMRPVLSPYTPNAGAEPVVVVGRDELLDSFDLLGHGTVGAGCARRRRRPGRR